MALLVAAAPGDTGTPAVGVADTPVTIKLATAPGVTVYVGLVTLRVPSVAEIDCVPLLCGVTVNV